MVVDYSKWDKLELSDDSDIEGHPNVDKASLIRWKQQSIREKRAKDKFRMDQLRLNLEVNGDLLPRVDALIAAHSAGKDLSDTKQALEIARAGSTKTKPALATSDQQPLYDDMIESMLEQAGDDLGKSLQETRGMITSALKDEQKELDGLLEDKAKHITSEDVRDGWNSTVFNKPQVPHAPEAESIEVLNPGASASTSASASISASASASSAPNASSAPSSTDMDSLKPATKQFGTLDPANLEASLRFLMTHPEIINENQKDALIMTAFDCQLAGDTKQCAQIVHQSLLIQYSAILGGVDGARKFIANISNKQHPARKGFDEEVARTTQHIISRCKILAEENAQDAEAVEQIQLHSVDPDTEIMVQVPERDSPGYAIYEKFSPETRAAIEAKSLDELNKVLGALSIPEAEELVQQLSESGVLLVEEKIYDVDEWQKKQAELEGEPEGELEGDLEGEAATPSASAPVSSIDELD